MAPALVKHSAAKERNSIGKKIFNLDCLSDIVFKRRLGKQSVFEKEILMENNSKLFGSIDIQLNDDMTIPMTSERPKVLKSPTLPLVCVAECNSLLETSFQPLTPPDKNHVNSIQDKKQNTVTIDKISQRISVKKVIEKRKDSVEQKLFKVDTNLNKLNKRLWAFQSKVFSSKIAVNLLPKFNTKSVEVKADAKSTENLISSIQTSNYLYSRPNGMVKPIAEDFKIPNESTNCKLQQSFDSIVLNQDVELSEFEFESKAKLTSKHRKKTENPAPNPKELHKWKQKRLEVGSRCSWLDVNITELDKKIDYVNKLQNKFKRNNRQKSSSITTESDINTSHTGDVLGDCARVHPIATDRSRHTYISMNDVEKCRLSSSSPTEDVYGRKTYTQDVLDQSYHPVLSFQNETSLSLLLEETLRNERINTKVTIKKSNKKKKKSNVTSTSISQPKNTEGGVSLLSRTRSRSGVINDGDVARKRHHAAPSSSTRSRKVRKLSDSVSCDSPKPLTPTHEMASPSTLTQNLKSHGFFPAISQKKKTGGDFDINNIVIPYSMASSTRLERIQYKEIPTPGWRSIWTEISLANGFDDWECTDDELYLERHDRCEMQEQKRFTNYFTAPANRRQRQNRSSECGFSEPASPLVIDELRSNTTTPADSPGGVTGKSSKLAARLATITPILEEERGPSWTKRRFPLSETESRKLDPIPTSPLTIPVTTEAMDTSLETVTSCTNTVSISTDQQNDPSLDLTINKTVQSAIDNVDALTVNDEEDKNWTVKLLNDSKKVNNINTALNQVEKPRKGIVLKLAKQ